MSQLRELARPFPKNLIKTAPQGKYGEYVAHHAVNERLLQILRGFNFELVEIIRGHAPEFKTKNKTYPARENAVVGVVARLTCIVDGDLRVIEEVGTEDNPAGSNDGDNLKSAMSDALKRCAMRLGLGLHLWSKDDYYLFARLTYDEEREAGAADEPAGEPPAAAEQTAEPPKAPSKSAKPAPPADSGDVTVTPPAGKMRMRGGGGRPVEADVLSPSREEAAIAWALEQTIEKGRGNKPLFKSSDQAWKFYEAARQEFIEHLDPSTEIADDDGVLLAPLETDIHKFFVRKVRAAAAGQELALPPFQQEVA